MVVGLGIAGAALLLIILIYNGLIKKKNQVDNAFGSIDAMLKKRYDLIPNLVETVKQYMSHEKDTLTQITKLRAQATSGNLSGDEKVDLENKISGQMRGIMVAVENYPDLKSSANFIQLQGSWNEAEEQIAAARRFFNSSVTDFNNAIQVFPNNMMAGMMGLTAKKVFDIPEEERKNVHAKDLFNS
jgi:LemA protein